MSRYMLIMRSTPEAEAAMEEANIDFNEIIESMGRFNEELIKAGVMLAGEGLTGPEEGFVVDFNSDPPVVTDGPYTEAKELFNGFWILDVSSKEEAKQWAKKVPLGKGVKLEVRRVPRPRSFRGQPVDRRRKSSGRPTSPRRSPHRRRADARQVCASRSDVTGADPDGSAPVRPGRGRRPWVMTTSPASRGSCESRAWSMRSRQLSPPTSRGVPGRSRWSVNTFAVSLRIAARSC